MLLECLEDRLAPAGDILATAVTGSTNLLGTLDQGEVDYYQFTASETGRLTVTVTPLAGGSLNPRLQLLDDQGQLLIQADDFTAGQPAAQIAQHLLPGTYYLTVSPQSEQDILAGDRRYVFTSEFALAGEAFSSVPVGLQPTVLVQGDVNGDGQLDLVSLNNSLGDVSILLGLGDGTFAPENRLELRHVNSLVLGDFNGDGKLDLAAGNHWEGASVLLGAGDGTFGPKTLNPGLSGQRVELAADFNNDGRLDLVVGGWILLGKGDGTFAAAIFSGWCGVAVAAGDFNGDSLLDLIAADGSNNSPRSVSLLLGRGDGTFAAPVHYSVGLDPGSLAVGDFNGDGYLDVAVGHNNDKYLAVLLGKGDGTLAPQVAVALPGNASLLRVGDFNRDGHLDLATDRLILLGRGDGTFPAATQIATGVIPAEVGDFNGDGSLDLASVSDGGNAPGRVSVQLGRGDGTFIAPALFFVGRHPRALTSGDFNRDGLLDVATANWSSGDVAVLLGLGDGTLAPAVSYPVSLTPELIVSGDFNGDGRLDLAVAGEGPYGVAVFLGHGDGSFASPNYFAWGRHFSALTQGDINSDGHLDLVGVHDPYQSWVSLLWGQGDGSFAPVWELQIQGQGARALAAGDLNGDGRLDLVTGNSQSQDFSVLLGQGGGTFAPENRFSVGSMSASWLSLADFNRDGRLDLVVTGLNTGEVALLHGQGDGTFVLACQAFLSDFPAAAGTVGDINGDGLLDVAVALPGARTVSILLGRGDGTLERPVNVTSPDPEAVAGGDLNADGRLDLLVANTLGNAVSVLVNASSPGTSSLSFQNFSPSRGLDSRHIPLYGDFDRDGWRDLLIVNRAGEMLFSPGLAADEFDFGAQAIVNPGRPVREAATVNTAGGQVLLAAVDWAGDAVSLYSRQVTGAWTRTVALPTGIMPVRLASGDLDGNGLDDLVVASALDNLVTIFLQQSSGQFLRQAQQPVGVAPSDISFADMDGREGLDIIVSGQSSGDVSVLFNDTGHYFARQARYRASDGLYGVERQAALVVRSLQETVGAAGADVTGDGLPDLIAVNRGGHNFSVLVGLGSGAFADPQTGPINTTSGRPGQLALADFNGDGRQDAAILMEDLGQLWVYLGQGGGSFATPTKTKVGAEPGGFTVTDVDGDGCLDVLIGNEFGDVLLLRGDGAGGFARQQKNQVLLAVADLNGDGAADAVLANQQRDQVWVVFRQPGTTHFTTPVPIDNATVPLLGPQAVRLTDLNADGLADLLAASSLGNTVLVYRGLAGGQFAAPESYQVGFLPVAVTAADLNGDGILDLAVPNKGSNDVSVLLGQVSGGTWTATAGPRLQAGGSGPLGVSVFDKNGDRIPDLVVTNSDGTVSALRGIGSGGQGTGFFNDLNPQLADLGSGIRHVTQSTLVTDQGAIVQFDPGTFTFQTLFNSRPVQVAGHVGGSYAAAFVDGHIGMLPPGTDGSLLTGEILGFVEQVSALEVLQNGNSFEVYVTQMGNDIPIIMADSDFIPVLTTLPTGPLVALGTPLPGVEVALLATLVMDIANLPDRLATEAGQPIGEGDWPEPGQFAAQVEVRGDAVEDATPQISRSDEETKAPQGAHTWDLFLLDVDDLYQRIHGLGNQNLNVDQWQLQPALTRGDSAPDLGPWSMGDNRPLPNNQGQEPSATPEALAAVFADWSQEQAESDLSSPLTEESTAADWGFLLVPAVLLHWRSRRSPAQPKRPVI